MDRAGAWESGLGGWAPPCAPVALTSLVTSPLCQLSLLLRAACPFLRCHWKTASGLLLLPTHLLWDCSKSSTPHPFCCIHPEG